MTRGLYYYKLVSPYPEDVTKNCKLTINEIDSNFFELKNEDIKTAEIVRSDNDKQKMLVLTRNNDEKIVVDLNAIAFDLNVVTTCNEDGSTTLVIEYSGVDGKKSIAIENIITVDGLMGTIDSKVLTKVITDDTLTGEGTVRHPLGLNGTYKPGVLAPVERVIELNSNEYLPNDLDLGTRILTKEFVHDYGYLYNGAGVAKISETIKRENKGWRVPSKKDWDALLNSLEPCEYQNHGSAKCHVELGKYAGTYLKSECGWNGQPICTCSMDKPITSCTTDDGIIDTSELNENGLSEVKPPYVGIDRFGMRILAAGYGSIDTHKRISTDGFSEEAHFWTTSHICDDPNQDAYVKEFVWNMSGVAQSAECPKPYYSVRLVKDYDGTNFLGPEYIDGVLYHTILFPQSKQVWTIENYSQKQGFITTADGDVIPEVIDVNNGLVNEGRKEYFINEWNGHFWEKRMLDEGETVIVQNPDCDGDVTYKEVCWDDKDGVHHCITVEIPATDQKNLEYRIYTETEGCDKVLVNTDDLVTERIMNVVIPILDEETRQREEADKALDEKIDAETERAISAETELWEALAEEASARTESDEQLWDAINQEASARTDVDNQLWDAIAQEASARTDVDNQIWNALNAEIQGRLDVDAQMWAAINAEAEARQTTDNLIWEALEAETNRAQEVEAQLWNGINGETARAQEVEGQLWDGINAEIARATAREDEIDGQLIDWSMVHPFSVAVTTDTHNLIMETKDKNPEHFINIDFSGDFGEI